MEVQIQNLTSFPMCMGQVWFEASSLCTAVSLNSYSDSNGLVLSCLTDNRETC